MLKNLDGNLKMCKFFRVFLEDIRGKSLLIISVEVGQDGEGFLVRREGEGRRKKEVKGKRLDVSVGVSFYFQFGVNKDLKVSGVQGGLGMNRQIWENLVFRDLFFIFQEIVV